MLRHLPQCFSLIKVVLAGYLIAAPGFAAGDESVYPAAQWKARSPADCGLSAEALGRFSAAVGGRGCVVRHGWMAYSWGDQAKSSDMASASKPLLSVLLWMAVQEGRLQSVEDRVVEFEPRLGSLNGGKDAAITWRHLAMQTSGYGLVETPGAAYAYNDFALALYYDTLMAGVFRTNGTAVLRSRLAQPLEFEDVCTFEAFGPKDRPGRLALSVRDFARFGLLCLRRGEWRGRQVVERRWMEVALNSPLSPDVPRTSGQFADMLPRQRSLGGTRNITPVGPGYYSFNWWLNKTNAAGKALMPDLSNDVFMASGHGGRRVLLILPAWDLVVCWNDSVIDDHDQSLGNPTSKLNRAVRLLAEAVVRER